MTFWHMSNKAIRSGMLEDWIILQTAGHSFYSFHNFQPNNIKAGVDKSFGIFVEVRYCLFKPFFCYDPLISIHYMENFIFIIETSKNDTSTFGHALDLLVSVSLKIKPHYRINRFLHMIIL
ncbi:hypothetical protein ACJX0J_012288, partial [Zea mays]